MKCKVCHGSLPLLGSYWLFDEAVCHGCWVWAIAIEVEYLGIIRARFLAPVRVETL